MGCVYKQPFVSGIAKDVGPMLSKMMEGEGVVPVLKIRGEVEKLMDERLKVRGIRLNFGVYFKGF